MVSEIAPQSTPPHARPPEQSSRRRAAHALSPAWRYGWLYGVLFLMMGASLPYLPVWLAHRGLSAEAIGAAAATGMVARFLVSLAGGYASDRLGDARGVFRLAALVTAGLYVGQWLAPSPWTLVVATVAASAAAAPLTPLLESSAMAAARREGFAYGPVRSVGSATFVGASVAVGALIDGWGPTVLIAWLIGVCVLIALSAGVLPQRPRSAAARSAPVWRVLTQADTVAAIAASALVQGGHGFYYWFSTLAWSDAGYSKTTIGVLWGWGIAAEIVFLTVFGRRVERYGPAALLAAGAVCGVVRWTAFAFQPDLATTFALQTLHAGTFAAAHLGIVMHIAARAPEHAAATLQSVNSGLALGGVLAAATALSGVLYDQFGALGYLSMAGVCAGGLAAAGVLWRLERRAL